MRGVFELKFDFSSGEEMRRWALTKLLLVWIVASLVPLHASAAITIANNNSPAQLVNFLTTGNTGTPHASVSSATGSALAATQSATVTGVTGTVNATALAPMNNAIMLSTGNTVGTGGNLNPAPPALPQPPADADAEITAALVNNAFVTSTGTFDSASVQFLYNHVGNSGNTAISFDLILVTNELPGAATPDAVVVSIGGVNKAVFNNGHLLSNNNAGVAADNAAGFLFTTPANIPGFTYNSQRITVTMLIPNPAVTASHLVKIAIADNNDRLTDSALIVGNFSLNTSTQEGMGVGDIFPPVITFVPASLQNIGGTGLVADMIEATATLTPVNLGAPTVTDNVTAGLRATANLAGPFPVGLTNVIWSATDAAGNVGTITQTVRIKDTTAPVISAPANMTFFNGTAGWNAAALAHVATVTATDLVDGAFLPANIINDAPANFPLGNTTVTFTATDAAGNVATAQTVITITNSAVINNVSAAALAQRVVENNATLLASHVPVAVVASANQTGLVDITSFGSLQVLPAPAAATPLTMPATSIMMTTGSIQGTAANPIGVNLGSAGDVSVSSELQAKQLLAPAGTFDAASLTFTFTVPAGVESVTFDLIYATNEDPLLPGRFPDTVVVMVDGVNTALFNQGNPALAQQLLSHQNQGFLFATAGNNIPGYNNVSQRMTLSALLDTNIAAGQPHTIKIAIADNTDAVVDSAVIIGNMQTSTATQQGMGVGDVLPPQVGYFDAVGTFIAGMLPTIEVEATGPTSIVTLGDPTGNPVPNPVPPATRTPPATPPVYVNPATINPVYVTDNVDVNPRAVPTPVGPYAVGTSVITWTSTDVAGNVGTAVQTLTIRDTTAPVFTAPVAGSVHTFAATSVNGLPATYPAVATVLGSAVATDAVGVVSLTNNAPANFPVGDTVVTFTATDASGLSATRDITVRVTSFTPPVPGPNPPVTGPGVDYIPPVMKLNGNATIEVVQGAVYTDAGAIAKDNVDGWVTNAIAMTVGGVAVTATTAVNTAVIGSTVITYTVTDAAANTSSISRVVTVVASAAVMKPVITTPTDILVVADDYRGVTASNGDVFTFLTEVLAPAAGRLSATGHVGAITNSVLSQNANPATVYLPIGKNVVVFTASNGNGSSTASATITVIGTGNYEPQINPADDTDGDGISDTWEISQFGSLLSTGAPTMADSDGDTIPDSWEAAIFASLLTAGAGTDFDRDGLLDSEEQLIGTNPKVIDTNPLSVGLKDSNDVVFPLEPSDSDGDGIFDVFENASSVLDSTIATGIPSAGRATSFSINTNGNPLKHVAVNRLASPAPVWLQNSFGELSYDVHTTVGATITVRITSSAPFGSSAQFYKVTAPGAYTLIPASLYTIIDANTVDFTLTDGGSLDLDGVANGVIVDPIAIGSATQVLGGGPVAGGGLFAWSALLFASVLLLPLLRRRDRS